MVTSAGTGFGKAGGSGIIGESGGSGMEGLSSNVGSIGTSEGGGISVLLGAGARSIVGYMSLGGGAGVGDESPGKEGLVAGTVGIV